MPCAFYHIALMPDAYVGFGMPIGGVLATQEAVIANVVGFRDIGCGIRAVIKG
jgi:tRNA-splicing ligase RtcB